MNPTMMKDKLLLLASTLGLTLVCTTALGQVFYARPNNNGGAALRFINPDGSGDTALGLPFPKVTAPTWSHDGTMLAVTATNPARPSLISLNAWTVNVATGATQQITHFIDNTSYQIAYAYYHAFSADKKTLAVNSIIQSGGTDNGSTTYTPILQLYPTNGEPGPTSTLHVGSNRDNVHHDGDGVDWSATQNVIAAPFKWDAPLNSGLDATYGKGEATAIFLIDPNTGNYRQLTVPHADVIFSGSFVSGTWAEEDYAPKFSPNGAAVAYVRSYQQNNGGAPDFDVQSLHIIDVNTGHDAVVLQFKKGLYCEYVEWSPDGTQLVFDLGQQLSSSGFPVQQANTQTLTVNVVNIDGSNPHQVVGAVSGTPSWRPGANMRPALLANLATRMGVGSGDNALIGGFIVTGFGPKKVLMRGIGPSLGPKGVPNPLADPLLELHQGNTILVSNDSWQQAPNKSEIPNGFAPSDPREAVIITTLNPGTYTALVKGAHGESGNGVVEVYDLSASTSSAANISTRGLVNTGDNIMIGGFYVGNGMNPRVVIRATGPSLAAQGVQGSLQDPTLDIRNANGAQVAFNDNWQSDANAPQVQKVGLAPKDPRESAIETSLAPGGYTAIVRGKNNTTGIAVVEVYNLL